MTTLAIEATDKKHKGLPLAGLEKMLSDIDVQPRWRVEAQRSADYYDGKQIEAAVLQVMNERGMAPLIRNFVAPAIDGVLGMEAKTRTDWIVRADNESELEMAEGLNEKLNESLRVMDANRACSDAYAAQVKTGLGWVEVNRNSDPFQFDYRCGYVHRREIDWDWFSKKPDLSDCRYLVRRKWVDADIAISAFPQHEFIINAAVKGWDKWFSQQSSWDDVPAGLQHAYQDYSQLSLNEMEYFDYGRDRLQVFECWYRVPTRAAVMKLTNGRVIQFDKKNAMHVAAVQGGHVQVITGNFPVMRMAFFIGPHRVMDIPSPLPHGNFPYIPFWGFREDGTSIPYGLIRRMISPQDEVNARLTKMMWLMTAKRVIMDKDATAMTLEEVVDEAARADGMILLNPDRKNRDRDAFRVEQDFALTAQQFDVMKSAEEAIQNASGVYSAMLGRNDADQSGVAISSLVEQSSTTLAELNDNYRYARRLVGEHTLALVVQDMGKKRDEEVIVNANRPMKTKHIVLNKQEPDGSISNDVTRTKAKVILDDITATAGYRAQIANRMMDLIATLPDDLKAPLMPIAIDATDIPQRDKMIEVLNRVLGTDIDVERMTPEQRQQYEAEQQQKAAERELQMAEMQQKVEEVKAKVAKLKAEAQSKEYEDRKKDAETEKIMQEIEQLKQSIATFQDDQVARIEADQAASEARNLLSRVDIESAVAGKPEPKKEPAAQPAPEPLPPAMPEPVQQEAPIMEQGSPIMGEVTE